MWDAGFYFWKYFCFFFCCRICSFHVFKRCHIFFFLKLFKLPLEKEGQVGGPILAQEEIKTIFGSIPDIYDVHTRIKVLSVRVQCYLVALSVTFILLVFFLTRVTWRSFWQTGPRIEAWATSFSNMWVQAFISATLQLLWTLTFWMMSVVLSNRSDVILWFCIHTFTLL